MSYLPQPIRLGKPLAILPAIPALRTPDQASHIDPRPIRLGWLAARFRFPSPETAAAVAELAFNNGGGR